MSNALEIIATLATFNDIVVGISSCPNPLLAHLFI